MNSEEIIKEIEKNRDKRKGGKKVGIFGSFVKGNATKESDIDIIVNFNKISYKNYFGLLILLENLFNRRIDFVIEEDLKPELKYVKKEAKYVRI